MPELGDSRRSLGTDALPYWWRVPTGYAVAVLPHRRPLDTWLLGHLGRPLDAPWTPGGPAGEACVSVRADLFLCAGICKYLPRRQQVLNSYRTGDHQLTGAGAYDLCLVNWAMGTPKSSSLAWEICSPTAPAQRARRKIDRWASRQRRQAGRAPACPGRAIGHSCKPRLPAALSVAQLRRSALLSSKL